MATGFSFGAKTTATPTFGTGSITFGTPATQPAQQFSFGNTLPSTQPSLFGAQSTPTTSSLGFKPTTFGPATTSAGFSLSTPSSGFSFGTSTPSFGAVSSAPSTGISFGAPAASTGLAFGTPASSAASTGLGFKPPTTGLAFGTPAPSTGLSFAAPAASSGLSFGATPAASTALAFGATTSAPSTGLSFGTTAAAPTLGLSFGAPSTASLATTSSGLPTLGLGGLTAISTAATSAPQNVGLGGIATTQSKAGASTAQKELPPKEQPLPNEFMQTVEQLKTWIQEEKNRSSDVARCSVKEYHKVENELDSLTHQFSQVENQLMNNRNLAEQLKYDTAKGLQHIEMAQRTQDTPPSLQYENTAPLQYFLDLSDEFEREMQLLKLKIDNTEKFVKKCNEPSILTSQDLALGLKRLHETFVALAGRMQAVHSQVESQKEAFLSLRKQAIKDNINPFERLDRNAEAMNLIMRNAVKTTPPNLASGPTPFNSIALGSNNVAMAAQQTQPPAYPITTATSLGYGFGNTAPAFGTLSTNNSLFKPTGFGAQPFQLNTSSNFQLQKPPTGNKRGKQ